MNIDANDSIFMSLQSSDETSVSGIPDLDGVVVGRRHQQATRRQLCVGHQLRVSLQIKPKKIMQIMLSRKYLSMENLTTGKSGLVLKLRRNCDFLNN
jgi:hypothetical protein